MKSHIAVLAAFAALTHAAQAAAPAKAVDAELLEFLGSLDVEESGWQEYLEHKPVKAPQQPEKVPPPKRRADPKQVKDK